MQAIILRPGALRIASTRFGTCLLALTGVAGAAPKPFNTVTGEFAGAKLTTGSKNSAFGAYALQNNRTGKFNTAIGFGAAKKTTGSDNVAVGFQALLNTTTGSYNVAIGDGALLKNTTGNGNIGIGEDAGYNNLGNDNINIGNKGSASGDGIIRVGTKGTHTNTYIAGKLHGDGSGLTKVSANAISGKITSAKLAADLVLGGTTTGNFEIPATTDSSAGVIRQNGETLLHTYGTDNTFAGKQAGNFTMTGQQNSTFGPDTLNANTTGSYNTASGSGALFSNTTGSSNTASGFRALYQNTTAGLNTASGAFSLSANTFGVQNTAFGANTLAANSSGFSNTAVGSGALATNSTGIRNTAIGAGAGVSGGGLGNATAIGAGAVVNASDKIRLGNSSVTVIEGQVAFTFTSDRTKKENFEPVDGAEVLRKLGAMEFTSWNYIGQDAREFRHYGAMAQDFHAAFGQDSFGTIGTSTTVNSGDMAGVMMSAIKELAAENKQLAAANANLEARLAKIEAILSAAPPVEVR